jgi:peptide subunit release factor 1 (eRF1)
MVTLEQIEELEAFDSRGARVLSLYLRIEPASQVRRSYRIDLEDLLREAREKLDESARADFATEAAKAQAWLDGQPQPRGKGLAVFSCSLRGLWRADFLAVPVMNHVTFEPRPDVAPLLELIDEYERYAVAVVDKEKARLFTVFAGEIEESEHFKDFVFGKTDQGGISQPDYQRHHEMHVLWHLKKVAKRLAELHRERPFDRLILAGPEEAATELRRLLSRPLNQRVVAVVGAELFANEREILDRTLEIERTVERQVEERLLGQLIELLGPNGRAMLGVEPTLAALWADTVQTLVVTHELHLAGSECSNCGRLDPGRIQQCPTCGKEMREVHDLVHRAMARAVEQSARVDVLHGAAGHRLMELGDGLGCLLRYPSPVPAQARV